VKVFEVTDPNKRANAEYRLRSIKTLRGHGLTLHYVPGTERQIQKVSDQSDRDYVFTYTGTKIQRVTDFSTRYVEYTWVGSRISAFRDVRGQMTSYEPHFSGNGTGMLNFIQLPRLNRPISGIVYDNQRRVISISSPMGTDGSGGAVTATTSFAWGDPLATNITRPGTGNNLRFNLDSSGNIASIVESHGVANRTTTMQRLQAGDLGANFLSRPNDLGLTRSATSSGAPAVNYTYATNGRGLVTSITEAGVPTYVSYPSDVLNKPPGKLVNNLALPTSVRDPVGNVFTTDFDRDTGEFKGLLKSLTKGAKITEYDPSTGQPRLMDDGRGNITELFYNSNGDIQRIRVPIDPDNANRDTVFEYPAGNANRGLPSAVIDRKGYRTEFVWDPAGNPTRIRAVGLTIGSGESSEIAMVYDLNGNRVEVTDRRGAKTTFSFDEMDRQWRVTQPGGAYSSTTFDPIGRPEQSRNFNGSISRQVYGTGSTDGGLLARVQAQLSGGGWEDIEINSYFTDGRLASTTDGEGITRSHVYDPTRIHLVKRINEAAPMGQNYREFDYNANEQIVRETIGTTGPAPSWPLQSTLYLYDSAARLDTVVNVMNGNWSNPNDPAHIRTRVTYYDDDQIDTVIDPRGKTIKHDYDPLGRLASRRDANNSEWTYRYDANGNLHREGFPGSGSYAARIITRSWGVQDRLESINYGDGVTPVVYYTYDANSNRTGMSDRWGSVSYGYDGLNRPVSISRNVSGLGGQTLQYSYFPGGQVQSITYPGNRIVNYTYDHQDRMKTVTPWAAGGSFVYTWRRNGQLERITNPNGTQTDYEYFPSNGRLSRLLSRRSGTVIADQQFTYDPVGNITRIQGDLPLVPPVDPAVTMEPDNANRLAIIAGQGVTNDPAGRSQSIPAPLNATTAWEGMDWLSRYTSGTVTTSYGYDGDGVRLWRSSSAGSTTRYLVDPTAEMPNVMVESDASNNPHRFYIHGASGLLASIDAAGTASTYHFSHRGDTLALTNAGGNVTESYGYSPYGVTVSANATWNPFRFIGQHGVMDEGNGLQFMRARYYSASVGRFLSLDQLPGAATEAQTLNRFAYASGEPLLTIDPSGYSSSKANSNQIIRKIEKRGENALLIAQIIRPNDNKLKTLSIAVSFMQTTKEIGGAWKDARNTAARSKGILGRIDTVTAYMNVATTVISSGGGKIAGAAYENKISAMMGNTNFGKRVGMVVGFGVEQSLKAENFEKAMDYGSNKLINGIYKSMDRSSSFVIKKGFTLYGRIRN